MNAPEEAGMDALLPGLDLSEDRPSDVRGKPPEKPRRKQGRRSSKGSGSQTVMSVDPADCRIWTQHSRACERLSEETCRDLIDGIRSPGRQEFAAIVRLAKDGNHAYEVISGARRHFAASWLRAHEDPAMPFLIEVRDLTDEAAFRLLDTENRNRVDISDYERAVSYLDALDRYYGGHQAEMAAKLNISTSKLSRYLDLARLPAEILEAFASPCDVKELHARELKPLLEDPETRDLVIAAAIDLAGSHDKTGAQVSAVLKGAVTSRSGGKAKEKVYSPAPGQPGIHVRATRKTVTLKFDIDLPREAFDAAISAYVRDHYGEE